MRHYGLGTLPDFNTLPVLELFGAATIVLNRMYCLFWLEISRLRVAEVLNFSDHCERLMPIPVLQRWRVQNFARRIKDVSCETVCQRVLVVISA